MNAKKTLPPLVHAWQMSTACNDYLLTHIDASYLRDAYAPRTRDVAGQFAHMHSVRVRWLNHMAPHLAADLDALPRGAQPGKRDLKKALNASAKAIAQLIEGGEESDELAHWNGPVATFVGYLIAHEAHHRGLAIVAMRHCGRKLDQGLIYGLWDWGKQAKR